MDKESQMYGSDLLDYYLRRVGSGALVGAGAASVINLIHNIRSNIQEHKERQKEMDPDEGTIVLSLPSKKEAACDKVNKVEGPTTSERPAIAGKKQFRNMDGKFGDSIAKKAASGRGLWDDMQSGPPNSVQLATGVLLALMVGAGGYNLADWRYNQHRKGKFKKEEDKAKQEYLDQLINKDMNKYSGYLDRVMCIPEVHDMIPMSKESQAPEPRASAVAGAYGLLALAALTGGSAYLTKKILDSSRASADYDSSSYKPPKTTRIIVRSIPPSTKNKDGIDEERKGEQSLIKTQMAEDELNQIKAAFWVIKDVVGKEDKLDKDAELKPLFKKHNTSVEKIAKVLDTKDVGLLDDAVKEVLPTELAEKIAQQSNMYDTFSPQFRAAIMQQVQSMLPMLPTLARTGMLPPQLQQLISNNPNGIKIVSDLIKNNPDAAYDILRTVGPSVQQLTAKDGLKGSNVFSSIMDNLAAGNLDINKSINKFKYGPDHEQQRKMHFSPIPKGIRSGELNPDDFHPRFRKYAPRSGVGSSIKTPPPPERPIQDILSKNPQTPDLRSMAENELITNTSLQDALASGYSGPGAKAFSMLPKGLQRSFAQQKGLSELNPASYFEGMLPKNPVQHPDIPGIQKKMQGGLPGLGRTRLGAEAQLTMPPPVLKTAQTLKTVKDLALIGLLGDSMSKNEPEVPMGPSPEEIEERTNRKMQQLTVEPEGAEATEFLTPERDKIIRDAIRKMIIQDLSRQRPR